MSTFALLADLLVAMAAKAAVSLLGAYVAPLHHLAAGRIRQLAGDFDVELEESLQGDVGGEALHALVGYSVFGSTFRTFHLEFELVYFYIFVAFVAFVGIVRENFTDDVTAKVEIRSTK